MKKKSATRRVTKKQVEKMRSHFFKKKGIIVWDNFCVAHLKIVSDNGMFEKCDYEEKPKKSCEGCYYNRRKKRVIEDKK
jgi:hypothetical protein